MAELQHYVEQKCCDAQAYVDHVISPVTSCEYKRMCKPLLHTDRFSLLLDKQRINWSCSDLTVRERVFTVHSWGVVILWVFFSNVIFDFFFMIVFY